MCAAIQVRLYFSNLLNIATFRCSNESSRRSPNVSTSFRFWLRRFNACQCEERKKRVPLLSVFANRLIVVVWRGGRRAAICIADRAVDCRHARKSFVNPPKKKKHSFVSFFFFARCSLLVGLLQRCCRIVESVEGGSIAHHLHQSVNVQFFFFLDIVFFFKKN